MLMFNAYHGIANFLFRICHSVHVVQYHLYWTLFVRSSFNQRKVCLYVIVLPSVFMFTLKQKFKSNELVTQLTYENLVYICLINFILVYIYVITYQYCWDNEIFIGLDAYNLYNNGYVSNGGVYMIVDMIVNIDFLRIVLIQYVYLCDEYRQ